MRSRFCAWMLLLGTSLLGPVAGHALELGGHVIADRVELGGRQLTLNGAGIRKKFVFKIYVAALYLERRASDPRAILASNGPWQLTMHFVRDVGHHQLLDAFQEAFEHNNAGQLDQLRGDLETFHAVLEDLRSGQDLWIGYVPGTGTVLHAPSGAVAVVPGKRFADALLRTWIGEHPSDEELKARLLGS